MSKLHNGSAVLTKKYAILWFIYQYSVVKLWSCRSAHRPLQHETQWTSLCQQNYERQCQGDRRNNPRLFLVLSLKYITINVISIVSNNYWKHFCSLLTLSGFLTFNFLTLPLRLTIVWSTTSQPTAAAQDTGSVCEAEAEPVDPVST